MLHKIDILVIGLEHVLPKVANWYAALETENIHTVIYSMDQFGLTRKMRAKLGVRVFFVPEFLGVMSRWFVGIPFLIFLLCWFRPRHVEVYDPEIAGRFWSACIELLRRLRVNLVILNRGGALGYDEQSPQKKLWLTRLYHDARCVIYKELYMKALFIKAYGLEANKLALVHNRVQVRAAPSVERSGKPIALYLNNFRRWKRPDLCVQAAAWVCQQIPDAEFWLVGDIPNSELATDKHRDSVWSYFDRAELQAQAEALGVGSQVKFFDFTDDPARYYEQAWVFLFPSDLVFCNFSLLEAMERGVPAIISDVQDGEKIVDDGITGFRVPQTSQAIAERALELFGDEAKRRSMGFAARKKIIDDYNLSDMARALAQIYWKHAWSRDA